MGSQSPLKSAGKDRWTILVLTYSRIFSEKRGSKSWKNQFLNLVMNLDRKDFKVSFCSRTFLLKLLIKLNGMMRDAYARCTLEMYDCNAGTMQWRNVLYAIEMVLITRCICHDADPILHTLWCNDDDALDGCMYEMHKHDAHMGKLMMHTVQCTYRTHFPRLKLVNPIHLSKGQRLGH